MILDVISFLTSSPNIRRPATAMLKSRRDCNHRQLIGLIHGETRGGSIAHRRHIGYFVTLVVHFWMSHVPVDVWKDAVTSPGSYPTNISNDRQNKKCALTHHQPKAKRECCPMFWEP